MNPREIPLKVHVNVSMGGSKELKIVEEYDIMSTIYLEYTKLIKKMIFFPNFVNKGNFIVRYSFIPNSIYKL
jgi:hypothetical protein